MIHIDASTQLVLCNAIFQAKEWSITMLSVQGMFLFWNKGATLLDGYTPDEIIGKPLDILHPPLEKKDNLSEYMLTTAFSQGSVKQIGRRLRKDGTVYVASVELNGIYNEEGKPIAFLRIARELKPNEKE